MPSKILKPDLVSLNLIYRQLRIWVIWKNFHPKTAFHKPFVALDQDSANLLKEDKIQCISLYTKYIF